MAKASATSWQELPLDVTMVQPNFLGTGTGAIVARFAKLSDAQAMQRCFWRKNLELRDASMQSIENLKPARRKKNPFHRTGSAATAKWKRARRRKLQ